MFTRKYLYRQAITIALIFNGFIFSSAFAENRTVNLAVAYKTVNYAGKPIQAIAVNNQIPGPTLHFKEGDHVTINVTNHLDKGTTIHWHGLIIPWNMDGVEGVSQEAIPPGGMFHYQFTLKQYGTYWYHAHAGLQEQEGLYGAIIIDPAKPSSYHYNKDEVIFLSDWSNTAPEQIYANLKKQGDYYSSKFPLQPSLMRFLHDYQNGTPAQRQKLRMDYQMMQQMRMSIYDISDVAYDAFLLNGQTTEHPWTKQVKVGDVIRLRFIGGGADTIFHVKIPGARMHVVHQQGHDVVPYAVNDFTLAPGETIDVLVKILQDKPYIIYAEAANTSGVALGALTTQPNQVVNYQAVQPFPTPEPATMGNMDGMDMSGMSMQDMKGMDMKTTMSMNMDMPGMKMDMPMAATAATPKANTTSDDKFQTTGTKYQSLKSLVKTNDPNKSVEVIKMELSGYMDRYIWFINGVPEYDAKPITIEPGKRYRLIFINNSMMHHPMHIHGHWFILRNGHGAYDPLLHTIDVPPGATAVADVDADASGQWVMHCHFLYHMMGGMMRIFRYSTFPQDVAALKANATSNQAIHSAAKDQSMPTHSMSGMHDNIMSSDHPMGHDMGLYTANYFELGQDFARNIQEISFKSLTGKDINKFELYTEDAEVKQGVVENADMDFFAWHLISEFWAIKGGVNYFYRPSGTPYWQPGVGIEGLMPYFIDTNLRTYYHSGSTKFDLQLSRDTQITNHFFVRLGLRSIAATKTVTSDEIGSGLNQMQYILRPYYQINPTLAVFTEYNHTRDYGALVNIRRNDGESATENTLTLGASLLF